MISFLCTTILLQFVIICVIFVMHTDEFMIIAKFEFNGRKYKFGSVCQGQLTNVIGIFYDSDV